MNAKSSDCLRCFRTFPSRSMKGMSL